MNLTDKRLKLLMDLLPPCGIAADIGTDHGKLGAALLSSGKCQTVWFSDISAPSLEKARTLIEKMELTDRAAFFVGDGAEAFPHAPDAAIIAGMGGNTIAHIIECGREKLASSVLLLEPNVGAYETRLALMQNGYRITDECAVSEGRHIYPVILAQPGRAEYGYDELIAGPVLMKKTDEGSVAYKRKQKELLEKALENAKKSDKADLVPLETELNVWKKLC